MNLYDLHYSREQAVRRLAGDRVFRQLVGSIMTVASRWDELAALPVKYGVSWACIVDVLDFLFGMRFGKDGNNVFLAWHSP